MAERPETHEHLEELYRRYGRDTVFISVTEAAKYCHIDIRTLQRDRTFPLKKIGKGNARTRVSLINFARWLSASN